MLLSQIVWGNEDLALKMGLKGQLSGNHLKL